MADILSGKQALLYRAVISSRTFVNYMMSGWQDITLQNVDLATINNVVEFGSRGVLRVRARSLEVQDYAMSSLNCDTPSLRAGD